MRIIADVPEQEYWQLVRLAFRESRTPREQVSRLVLDALRRAERQAWRQAARGRQEQHMDQEGVADGCK